MFKIRGSPSPFHVFCSTQVFLQPFESHFTNFAVANALDLHVARLAPGPWSVMTNIFMMLSSPPSTFLAFFVHTSGKQKSKLIIGAAFPLRSACLCPW